MLSGIHIFCFFASYLVVLGLEVSRLFFRMPVRLVVMLGFAAAGFVAHTLYLWHGRGRGALPLSSWHDWYPGRGVDSGGRLPRAGRLAAADEWSAVPAAGRAGADRRGGGRFATTCLSPRPGAARCGAWRTA